MPRRSRRSRSKDGINGRVIRQLRMRSVFVLAAVYKSFVLKRQNSYDRTLLMSVALLKKKKKKKKETTE